MVDVIGQELQVGDTVVITSRNTSRLYLITIAGFTKGGMIVLSNGRRKYTKHSLKLPTPSIEIPEGQVTISQKEYEELQVTQRHMDILDEIGVDNWGGYRGRGCVEAYCEGCGGDTARCDCNE